MDRKQTWGWLPAQMPQVARLIAQKRAELGEGWVNTCWQRGVVQQQPGWFYAAEGALAVGTPWADDPVVADLLAARVTPTQALLVLRPVGAQAPAQGAAC